jgi:hypothetical protein
MLETFGLLKKIKGWKKERADIFWGEVAPCDHVLQVYENDEVFIDTLCGFIGGGVKAGDCVIIVATEAHLKALDERLISYGIQVQTLIDDDRYIPLNAEETLAKFMVNGWPDEQLFDETISAVIGRATAKDRRIRVFGEMVAILWAQGNNGATVQLENLWNHFCEKQEMCLFCAYPKAGFTQDIKASIQHICNTHTRIIDGAEKQLSDVYYKDSRKKTG